MINPELGGVPEMLAWARSIIESRPPDFIIQDGAEMEYMRRWFVVPRNPAGGCYLHQIVRSDKDVHHDHPWDNTSYVLDGTYVEELIDGTRLERGPGSIVHRKATDAHRLILPPGEIVTTLFMLGPWQRDWGFHCPKGWQHWKAFTGGYHDGRSEIGRGCGEYA